MYSIVYLVTILLELFLILQTEPPSVILHHCVVLGLLLVSYIMNFTRIGALVIFYHDLPKCLIEVSSRTCLMLWGKFSD